MAHPLGFSSHPAAPRWPARAAVLAGKPSSRREDCEALAGNQLRLIFSGFAYVLMDTLRRVALKHTQFADASVHTIRIKLLKLGAQVRTSVRRIHVAIASSCPNQVEFEMAHLYLRRAFNSG